jgi:hypothetical protein
MAAVLAAPSAAQASVPPGGGGGLGNCVAGVTAITHSGTKVTFKLEVDSCASYYGTPSSNPYYGVPIALFTVTPDWYDNKGNYGAPASACVHGAPCIIYTTITAASGATRWCAHGVLGAGQKVENSGPNQGPFIDNPTELCSS